MYPGLSGVNLVTVVPPLTASVSVLPLWTPEKSREFHGVFMEWTRELIGAEILGTV